MGLPDLSSLSLEPRPAPTAVVVGADGMTKHGDARAFDLVPGHMYDVLPDGLQKEVKSDDFTLVLPNECSVMKCSMAALIVSLTAERQELASARAARERELLSVVMEAKEELAIAQVRIWVNEWRET